MRKEENFKQHSDKIYKKEDSCSPVAALVTLLYQNSYVCASAELKRAACFGVESLGIRRIKRPNGNAA